MEASQPLVHTEPQITGAEPQTPLVVGWVEWRRWRMGERSERSGRVELRRLAGENSGEQRRTARTEKRKRSRCVTSELEEAKQVSSGESEFPPDGLGRGDQRWCTSCSAWVVKTVELQRRLRSA